MKRLTDQLERERALRDEAWGVVRDDVSLMRADLDQRSVGGRIADRASASAREMAGQTLKAAGEHRALLGAGAVALALWLARGPLIGKVRSLLAKESTDDDRQE